MRTYVVMSSPFPQLEIDGWERLCMARNQQLDDVSREKEELEERIQTKLEELNTATVRTA